MSNNIIVYLSVNPSVYVYVYNVCLFLCFYLYFCLSVYLSARLPVCLSACVSTCASVRPSICVFVFLSILSVSSGCLSVNVYSICACVSCFRRSSFCLTVCLPL